MEPKMEQEYVDTQERIDAFWDEADAHLSIRALNLLIAARCKTPTDEKKLIESNFEEHRFRNAGKKTETDIKIFFEEFEQEHPAGIYHQLSPKGQLAYTIIRNSPFLTEDEQQFVRDFVEAHGYTPTFYLISKYFEHTNELFEIIVRENWGLCGPRKSLEQISKEIQRTLAHTSLLYRKGARRMYWFAKHFKFLNDNMGHYEQYFPEDIQTPENISFEPIREAEQLKMDAESFVRLSGDVLPFLTKLEREKSYWVFKNTNYSDYFRYGKLIDDIETELKNKRRYEKVIFDLEKICRDKEYWYLEEDVKRPVKTAFPTIIELSKLIIKDELGLDAKGNKIIIAPNKTKK